ncbi:MAG TPA: hypothetical protein VFL83_11780 [Anaeromyxobacter sp.]|nr:hypothetical protein [Anaeromyxobacter sp.]
MMPVELTGIDGRNLLGFLGAVGAHVALDRKVPGVRLSWDTRTFRPTISLPVGGTGTTAIVRQPDVNDRVITLLACALKELPGGASRFPWDDIKVGTKGSRPRSRAEFRTGALEPAANAARRDPAEWGWADFAAGLGSDAAGSHKEVAYTALCVITGDSHQHFLGFMRDLHEQVTAEHLKSALFTPWRYCEVGRSFRWDPTEDRRYALRASDPAKGRDKEIPSMWGANRLAFEALACFPCFPRGRRARTTAFEDERAVRWPLWGPPIDLRTVRSLLAHPAVVRRDGRVLSAMGVFAIASSRRTSVGRKRTFGPAALWPVPGP